MDALILSRIQFAANISFHILFPTINIALAWFLVYFRLRNDHAARTGDLEQARQWEEAYFLWTKVFALTFALGVVLASHAPLQRRAVCLAKLVC